MSLSLQQYQTLKTWLLANAGAMSEHEAAAALNAPASPAYYVYRTALTRADVMKDPAFNWTLGNNLNVTTQKLWDWLFSTGAEMTMDPSLPNMRAGVNEVWAGTEPKRAVRYAVWNNCYDVASVADKMLAVSGAGTLPDANGDGPAVRGYDSQITPQDVIDSYSA